MAQIQYWPVNKFPWLTNDEIDRLEQYTANLTWANKFQEQHKLYEEVIRHKQQEAYKNDRSAAINEMTYRGVKSNNKTERNKSSNLSRQEVLADMAKEHYNLPYDTDTNTVLQWVIKDAQMKWVSPDLLNKYINHWDESFLYEMWYKEQSTLKNIAQWALDSLVWWMNFIDKYVANPVAAKMATWLWADKDKVNQQMQENIKKIDNLESSNIWWNRESTAYAVSNTATDIAQLAWWETSAAKALTWIPKVAKLINATNKLGDVVEQFPILWKLTKFTAKKWSQWAVDTILYNAINWEWTDLWDATEWGLINTALWVWWKLVPTKKWVESFAKKLEVQWLVNWKILETVNQELKKAWSEELQWVKSAWNWLLTRQMKWSADDIAKQLTEYAGTFSKAKDELLDLSQTFRESEYTRNAIDFLKKEYEGSSILTKDVKAMIEWLNKLDWKTTFTAKEISQVEKAFDKVADIYKNSTERKAWFENIALDEIRRWMKKDIEEIIEKDWLWNMRAINNEIQVAKTLEKWITGKLYSEEAQAIIPKSYSSAFWSIIEIAWFPRAMRSIANLLTKFSWMDKTTIAKKLDELWNFDEDFLKEVIPSSKRESFVESLNELVWKEKGTSLATKTQLVPKAEKKSKQQKVKSAWNINVKSLIRKYLLTQTEEWLDED